MTNWKRKQPALRTRAFPEGKPFLLKSLYREPYGTCWTGSVSAPDGYGWTQPTEKKGNQLVWKLVRLRHDND